MEKNLQARMRRAAESKWAEVWLSVCGFFNSFILPTPAEALLVPLCLAKRERCWRYAGIATLAGVLGGLVGYMFGALAFNSIGAPIIEFYNADDAFNAGKEKLKAAGIQWILLATITPLPYKVVTITSGVVGMNMMVFLLASIVGRSTGYFLLAAAIWFFGENAMLALRSTAFRAVAIIIFVLCALLLLR